MTKKIYIKWMLLLSLTLISFYGWLIHLRVHPLYSNTYNYIPFVFGLLSIVIIPSLFVFKKTFQYGYVLNGMTVIIGTITMAHYSIINKPATITINNIFLNILLGQILLLWAKFFLGKAIFELERMSSSETIHKGKFLRYPNMGFWIIHLIAMSILYIIGNILRK